MGLILAVIAVILLILPIILLTILLIKKKYNSANRVYFSTFLISLVSVTMLSWSVIIMNNFNYNLSLYVGFDFTWLLYLFLPFLAIFVSTRHLLNARLEGQKGLMMFANRTFPIFLTLLYTGAIGLFYFNLRYYSFLLNFH